MPKPDRTSYANSALASAAAIAAFASLAPSPASAADYDMDCKLLLCMPSGFPSGCSDAFDHMMDLLRNGRSPNGFCAMLNGEEYAADEIDYRMKPLATPEGWQCRGGQTFYHRAFSEDGSARSRSVNTFCYDAAYTHIRWSADGNDTMTTYTNKAPPARRDFWINLTMETGTTSAFSQGRQRFDTGRTFPIDVRYTE